MHRHHKLPCGAEVEPGAGVRFRLWAPRAETVSLSFGDNVQAEQPELLPMRREAGGWFSITTGRAGPGTRYRYAVDDALVPDPASRHQPEGVHGSSEVIDPTAYEWRDLDWKGRRWEEIVLYELHVGTFSETGDFAGVARHLDHLVDLGVTALELMPIADFPGERNWGYDGVLLYAPAARYGRPEALKALVEACHERGLAIILDVVYNHFGPEGNYLPTVAPDYFTDRHKTPWGAAVDYAGAASRAVRDFVIENALYWLDEFHFDGLRLDAVHAIIDETAPDIVTEIAQTVRRRIADREVHLILENDRNEAHRLRRRDGRVVGYNAQWNDDLHHVLHVLITGETGGYYADYMEKPVARLGRALASGFVYQGETSPTRGEPRGEPSGDLPPTAFVSFLQNHDQVGNNAFGTRIASRAEEALLHTGVAILLLSPQIPMLFMGEEWATTRPFAFFCDFEPELAEAVRVGRRREFAHFPEFQDEAALAEIPDPTAPETFCRSRLDWAERGGSEHVRWFQRYRRLIALRIREIAPRLSGRLSCAGEWRLLGDEAVLVRWRLSDDSCLVAIANFGAAPTPVERVDGARLLYSTKDGANSQAMAPCSARFWLAPPAAGIQ
ncbi:MAG: malto-oligosyltrehalose trehalohydrolase [Alphaproteobacteria bacterium]|nr:malto-oligosyltrehalose trehalohydrolase [Alphaproteobacteria bacterium]